MKTADVDTGWLFGAKGHSRRAEMGGVAIRDSAINRKARGAFPTPPELCSLLAEWAIRTPRDSILEPSCGNAQLLLAADRRLRILGGPDAAAEQLHGVEIDGASVADAEMRLTECGARAILQVADFFDIAPAAGFDAVIGNPPYIRYQSFSGDARAKAQRAALRQGVRLAGLANSWAAFVIHAAAFLKPAGRLALVLPAELLSVNYAAPVREFLLRRFATVRVVLFEPRVFPGVLEEVVLLLAEGVGPTTHCELHQAKDTRALRDDESRQWTPLHAKDRWNGGLLEPEAMREYSAVTSAEAFSTLLDWGDTSLGMVTGNNRFFTLTAQSAIEFGLKSTDLSPISPPSSRHLRGLSFGERAWNEMRDGGFRVFLFYPSATHPSDAARRYIEQGSRLDVPLAYKCRVRSPWWRVPTVAAPDLFLTYMNHDTARIVANRARLRHLNSVHGVTLRADRRELGTDLLPIASLNTVTLLGAEIVGRSYGGGILKLEPKEADRLPVPSLTTVMAVADDLRNMRPQLAKLLRARDLLGAVRQVDRIVLRKHLRLSVEQLKLLRAARAALFARRDARAESNP